MRLIDDDDAGTLGELIELIPSHVAVLLAQDRVKLLNTCDGHGCVGPDSATAAPETSDHQWLPRGVLPGAAIHPDLAERLDGLLTQLLALGDPQHGRLAITRP